MPTVGDVDLLRTRLAQRFPAAEPFDGIDAVASRLGRPVRVAVIRSDGIGDWILCLSLVDGLLASDAVAEVTLVAPAAYRSLLGRRDGVGFEPFDAATIIAPPAPGGALGKALALSWVGQRRAMAAGSARRGRYDLAVLPRWDTDAGFNARAWALGAGLLIAGHDPALVPGAGPSERAETALLSIRSGDDRPAEHDTARAATLAKALGIPIIPAEGVGLRQFGVTREDRGGRPLVLVHAGSNEPKRRWPVNGWRHVVTALVAKGAEVVLVGGPDDVETNARILAGIEGPVRSTAGSLPLGELPALAARAAVLVSNDSGPAHIACSVGTPVVTVIHHSPAGDPAHRSSPDRFGPWGAPHRVLRPAHSVPPCVGACTRAEAHCIAAVPAEEVAAAALDMLALQR